MTRGLFFFFAVAEAEKKGIEEAGGTAVIYQYDGSFLFGLELR